MTGTRIALVHPVTVDGTEITALTLRRPKVRDQIAAQDGGGTDADKEIRLCALLTNVSEAVLRELDLEDYIALQQAMKGFFPAPPDGGAR